MTVVVFGVFRRQLVELGCDLAESARGGVDNGCGGEGGRADGSGRRGASGVSEEVSAEHCGAFCEVEGRMLAVRDEDEVR